MRLSIFWRLILTYVVIIAVMTAVNIYALLQIRTLAGLNTEVGSHHHPEIESAKRLLSSFYEQVQSEKKYVAVPAATFLEHFDAESKDFQAWSKCVGSERSRAADRGVLRCSGSDA